MKKILSILTAIIPFMTIGNNASLLKYQNIYPIQKKSNTESAYLQNKNNLNLFSFRDKANTAKDDSNYTADRTRNVPQFNKYQKSLKLSGYADTFFTSQNGTVYVAGKGYVYYSNDGKKFKQIKNIHINQVWAYFQSKNGTIYIINDSSSGSFEVIQSKDGINFSINKSLLGQLNGVFTGIFQAKNNTIYIGFQHLYQSKDGINFTKNISLSKYYINETITIATDKKHNGSIFQAKNGVIYLLTSNGIFLSKDGIKFSLIKIKEHFSISNLWHSKDGIIYLFVYDAQHQYIYSSSEDSLKFTLIKTFSSILHSIHFYQSKKGIIYLKSSEDLFVSQDGKHFTCAINKSNMKNAFGKFYEAQDGTIYLLKDKDTQQDVYESKDGIHFSVNQTMSNRKVNSMLELKNNTIYLATQKQGLYTNTNSKNINFNKVQAVPSNYTISNIVQANNGIIYLEAYSASMNTANIFTAYPLKAASHINMHHFANYIWNVNYQTYYEIKKEEVTFSFDQNWVKGAMISINQNPSQGINFKKPYTLINKTNKPELATITINHSKNESESFNIILDSNGISTLTFNKVAGKWNNLDIYNLDIYINSPQTEDLIRLIQSKNTPAWSEDFLKVLVNKEFMGSNAWKNFFNKSMNLKNEIQNCGNVMSYNNLYASLTQGDSSVLNFDDAPYGHYDDYRNNLVGNIYKANYSKKGVILHFKVSYNGGYLYVDNFLNPDSQESKKHKPIYKPRIAKEAYNSIVLSQN